MTVGLGCENLRFPLVFHLAGEGLGLKAYVDLLSLHDPRFDAVV